MSLDYRFKEFSKDNPLHVKWYEVMVFATLMCGLPVVTKSNVEEWMFRIEILKALNKSMCLEWNENAKAFVESYPSEEVVTAFIGLCTNATRETRPAWLRRIWAGVIHEVNYQLSKRSKK